MNAYLELIRQAHASHWCMRPFCTTCGSREFRSALAHMADLEGNQLVAMLESMDLRQLCAIQEWDGALRLTLDSINSAEMMDRVLTAWLPQLDNHIRIADLILYYYVRRGALFAPMSVAVLEQWRDKCIELATRRHDTSLVESLIYTLGDYRRYPEFKAVVEVLAANGSRLVKQAIRRQNHVD